MASPALSASSYYYAVTPASSTSSSKLFFNKYGNGLKNRCNVNPFRIRASSEDDADCNTEECAPDKEVGKVSVEWLAGEKTKVVGTFPPRTRGWTGYVEKDTAGQTNIYSVEPAVYVAENAISSGQAGSSSDGSENTLAIAGFLALISVAAASSILIQVGKNAPIQTLEYSGPALSYFINKFKTTEVVEPLAPIETTNPSSSQPEASAPIDTVVLTSSQLENSNLEAPEVQVEPEPLPDTSGSNPSVS
ncbi:OLC1v1020546C1 [Oldenlandia corymbosa var. corymbosa]|uniref:OLC1v1020546C1 n=1 Tax=Oldenlandia corymbosa var. corymbosa TaxID=529605 RepID=A0AAV1EGZ8_OLDCO|nr:OLC1v1020546C1 [Oldenlandia corymbosa var. corymbosa]